MWGGSGSAQMYCTEFSETSKGIFKTVYRSLQTGMMSLETTVKEKKTDFLLKIRII